MIAEDSIYPSKKGTVIYIPVILLTAVVCFNIIIGQYWGGVFCAIILLAIVAPMILNTNYTITGDGALKVRCGFFVNLMIDINTIRKIEATKSMLSSPALSLDRLEVFYNKFDSVIISPQNKDDFIARLQSINPAIEYIKKTS